MTYNKHFGFALALSAIVALSLIARLAPGHFSFHGLEYEDSFVHQAAARSMHYSGITAVRETIPLMGSLAHPVSMQSFYHYAGYAALICAFASVVGDTPLTGHLVSLVLSILTAVMVYLSVAKLLSDKRAALLCVGVYLTMPLANVWATATCAEVASGFAIMCVVYSLAIWADQADAHAGSLIAVPTVITALMFATLVKRENMMLIFLAPFVTCLFSGRREAKRIFRSCLVYSVPSLICIGICFALGIVSVYRDEVASIDVSPFSLRYALRLLPVFVQSTASYENSFIWGWLLLLVPFALLKTPKYAGVALLLVGYLAIYSCHWRSYYFLMGQEVSIHDADRYLLALTPLLAILFGSVIHLLSSVALSRCGTVGRHTTLFTAVACALIFTCSCILSRNIKSRLTDIEHKNIKPFIEALNYCEKEAGVDVMIATFNVCYFQIYGRSDLQLFDLRFINRTPAKWLDDRLTHGRVYCVLNADNVSSVNQGRYEREFAEIKRRFLVETPTRITGATILKQRPVVLSRE